jgi:hypothetical protein
MAFEGELMTEGEKKQRDGRILRAVGAWKRREEGRLNGIDRLNRVARG